MRQPSEFLLTAMRRVSLQATACCCSSARAAYRQIVRIPDELRPVGSDLGIQRGGKRAVLLDDAGFKGVRERFQELQGGRYQLEALPGFVDRRRLSPLPSLAPLQGRGALAQLPAHPLARNGGGWTTP